MSTPHGHAATPSPSFVVLMPAKPPAAGKSRLGGLPAEHRSALAAAFALDTAEAALGAERVSAVLAVTDDHRFARDLSAIGCSVIPDGVGGDLNATLRQAAAEAQRRWPGLRPVALTGDLPALRSADLDATLLLVADLVHEHGEGVTAFVRDAPGSGTSLYTAPAVRFLPRFGPDSAARHLAAGCIELDAPATVRRDVDQIGDLGAAMVLGLGPRSARATGRS